MSSIAVASVPSSTTGGAASASPVRSNIGGAAAEVSKMNHSHLPDWGSIDNKYVSDLLSKYPEWTYSPSTDNQLLIQCDEDLKLVQSEFNLINTRAKTIFECTRISPSTIKVKRSSTGSLFTKESILPGAAVSLPIPIPGSIYSKYTLAALPNFKSMVYIPDLKKYNASSSGGESKASYDISLFCSKPISKNQKNTKCSAEEDLIKLMTKWRHKFDPSFFKKIKRLIAILDVDTLSKIETEVSETLLELAVNYALESENSEILEALLKKGVDPNVKFFFGNSPLSLSLGRKRESIVRLLLEHKANPMIKNEIIDIFKMNDDIVVQALQNIPEPLIVNEDTKDFKAFKDAVNRKFQKSRQENNANLAILLLKKFGGLIEKTALHRLLYEWAKKPSIAKDISPEYVLQALIKAGADVNAKICSNATSLHWAAVKGHLEVVEALLANGAYVTAKNDYGMNTLHLATRRGNLKIAKTLLANGADIFKLLSESTAKNNDGETALHTAAKWGLQELINVLIESGMDVTAKNNDGKTVLQIADEVGCLEMAKRLAIIELLEKGVSSEYGELIIPDGVTLSTPDQKGLYKQALSNYNETGSGGESKASDGSESFKIEIDKMRHERKLSKAVLQIESGNEVLGLKASDKENVRKRLITRLINNKHMRLKLWEYISMSDDFFESKNDNDKELVKQLALGKTIVFESSSFNTVDYLLFRQLSKANRDQLQKPEMVLKSLSLNSLLLAYSSLRESEAPKSSCDGESKSGR